MKIYFLFISFLISYASYATTFAGKKQYLIDELVLEELTLADKKILDSCLNIYHHDAAVENKILALSYICDNLSHGSWTKYQQFQHEFIIEVINRTKHKNEKDLLLVYLIDAENNLGLMEIDRGNYTKARTYYKKSLHASKLLLYTAGEISAYHGIAYVFQRENKLDSALFYYNIAYDSAGAQGDYLSMAHNLCNIAEINRSLGNIEEAIVCNEKTLELYKKVSYQNGVAIANNNLALIYVSLGRIDTAVKLFGESIKIFKEKGLEKNIAIAYNNIGDIYFNHGDFESALSNYNFGLEIYKSNTSKINEAMNLSNVARVYVEQKDFEKALYYFDKSLEIEEAIENEEGIARCYYNKANLYYKLGEIDKAIEYGENSIALYENLNYTNQIAISSISLAGIYLENNMYQKALFLAERAYSLANEKGYVANLRDASLILYKIAQSEGDYKKALNMYEVHIVMRDSLINLENNTLLISEKLQRESDEKTQDLEKQKLKDQLKLEEQRSAIKNYKFFGILMILFLVTILLFVLWRRSKYELNIKWLQEDILKSQMKPHFIFNVMVSIQSLIVQGRYKEAIYYLSEIATFMRSSLSNISSKKISFEKELELAKQYLELEKLRFKEKLNFEIETNLHEDIKRFQVPPFITQPIIENAIIHGFKNISYTGVVKINAKIEDGNLIIRICDNGVGIQVEKKSKSEGIKIVRARLKLFNPRNKFMLKEQSEGTCAQITFFPVKNNLLKN